MDAVALTQALPQVSAPSAGGAPLVQVAIVGAFTAAVYAVLAWIVLRERAGKRTLVGRAADAVARLEGGPRWFALPSAIAVLGALSGATGVYWDVSIHIAGGRDEGPLANPAHYLIFLGLMAIFVGGALGMALADDRMPRRTLRLGRNWQAPLGASLGTAIAMCALLGFPLDDLWHRAFGQDVTEWGPTHVIMIGGTIMLPYALLLAASEAKQVGGSKTAAFWEYVGALVLLIGPVAFLLEFAYGVPQFPLINDVTLVTIGAVVGFAYTVHKGAAYVAATWIGYAVIQACLTGVNVFFYDALTPKMPSLLGGALVALVLTRWAKPTVGFAAASGLLIGLGNLPVDYYWTQWYRPMEWPPEMLPYAIATAAVAGLGTGLVATWMYLKLGVVAASDSDDALTLSTWVKPSFALGSVIGGRVAAVGLALVVLVMAINVPPRTDVISPIDVAAIEETGNGRAHLTVQLDDKLAQDAYWFEVLSWQGGGLVRSEFEQLQPGVYRTLTPVPIEGDWKTLIRIQLPVHVEVSAPVYLPEDPAIENAFLYPAQTGVRDFIEEKLILQREAKVDVDPMFWTAAYLVVGGVFTVLLGSVAYGYTMAGRPGRGQVRPLRRRELQDA